MDKTTINEIVQFLKELLIKNGLRVDSIALFGSALSGEMHEDSDIDLIIISSDFINKDIFERSQMTMKPEIETLKKFKVSMDVLNLSPEEYDDSIANRYYDSKIVA
ncbi:MAG: nucleotidyltransferase domain-containing protein [Bacteroidota bacterium]|nr:nucleotidyltransferase domain-containing protein [Bacteroidota bacterium]